MAIARLLQYVIPFEWCEASATKALELVPEFDEGEWHCVERDDLRDVFRIWHLVGDYH